jgi:hypothetical protein
MDQNQENQSMMHGIPLDALPVDDHQAHLSILDRFSSGQFFQTMPEDRVILFAMHKRQHLEMMQQQARTAAQPVAPGMGNNVPSGMTQNGGSDLNALEGGVQ